MSKYLTLTKDVVKNSNIKYNDIRKVQQIIAEKGELVFVSSDYEDKEVPKDQIIKLYDKILEDQMKYDERQKYDKKRVEDIVIDVVHYKDFVAVYMEGNVVKGFISLQRKQNKECLINTLFTDDEYRNTGIGTYMLRYAEFIAHGMECDKLILKINNQNSKAIDFYLKCGFTQNDQSNEDFHFFSMESRNSSILKKYSYNNKREVTGRRRFKCMDCGQRFGEFEQLVKHASKYHKDLVGDEDIYKYLYEKRNPGPYICIICKKNPREWDPVKRKYNRICNSPECAKKSREEFRKNMKKVYGTDNLLTDPDRQAKMMANRSISGKYKFPDGVEITYVGTYELDFLEYLVEKYKFDSTDIIECPREMYIKYYDDYTQKERWYIPDFYLPKYDLVVEIKDGSKYPQDSKRKSLLKDKAVIKADKFNYIKIVDKDYTDLDNYISSTLEKNFSESKKDSKHIFMIPEQKFSF